MGGALQYTPFSKKGDLEVIKLGLGQSSNENEEDKEFTGPLAEVFNNSKEQFLQYIKNAAKSEIQEQIKLANSNIKNVELHSGRKIWHSQHYNQTIQQQEAYKKIIATPLGNIAYTNPYAFAAAQTVYDNEIQLINSLDDIQMAESADAFFADGMIRAIFGRFIDFVLPDYTKVTLTKDPIWEENKGKLQGKFNKNETEILELDASDVAWYHIKVSRLMETLKLWDAQIKLLGSSILFGRNGLFIQRDAADKKVFKKLGKPTYLYPLNPTSIKKARINNNTKQFDGFFYDWGVQGRAYEPISRDDLIPFFYDDFPIYKNTHFSGMSRVFSCVGLAHANQLINSYDMPEATKTQYSGTSFVYVGAESDALVDLFAANVRSGLNPHNKPNLRVDEATAAKNIISIIDARLSNYKAMCIILGIPEFLMFGDAANYATAAITMQVFINGTVHRMVRSFGDYFREYFFLPLLADITNKEIDELQEKYIDRIKVINPNVTLETKTDRINNALGIWEKGGFGGKWSEFFKWIGEDQLADLAKPLDKAKADIIEEQNRADINEITANETPASEMGRRLLTNFGVRKSATENGNGQSKGEANATQP